MASIKVYVVWIALLIQGSVISVQTTDPSIPQPNNDFTMNGCIPHGGQVLLEIFYFIM